MRIFIAAHVPMPVRKELEGLRSEIEPTGARGRWTKAESMHLTFKFLGETQGSRVPEILDSMERAASGHQPMALEARGLGVFPHLQRPRILWAGLTPQQEMRLLQEDLEGELESLGFAPEERSFHPHLTLLRIKSRPDRIRFARLVTSHRDSCFGQFSLPEMILFQSLLKPEGAEYNVLGRAPLGPANPI